MIDIANAPSDEEYKSIAARYLQNHSRLMELINEEFGLEFRSLTSVAGVTSGAIVVLLGVSP